MAIDNMKKNDGLKQPQAEERNKFGDKNSTQTPKQPEKKVNPSEKPKKDGSY